MGRESTTTTKDGTVPSFFCLLTYATHGIKDVAVLSAHTPSIMSSYTTTGRPSCFLSLQPLRRWPEEEEEERRPIRIVCYVGSYLVSKYRSQSKSAVISQFRIAVRYTRNRYNIKHKPFSYFNTALKQQSRYIYLHIQHSTGTSQSTRNACRPAYFSTQILYQDCYVGYRVNYKTRNSSVRHKKLNLSLDNHLQLLVRQSVTFNIIGRKSMYLLQAS